MFGNNGTRVASWLYHFLPMSRCHGIKRWLLRNIGGIEVGDGTHIWSSARFSGKFIKIGKNCFFGEDNLLIARSPDGCLTIGDNVTFGPCCYVATGAHKLGSSSRRSGQGWHRPITIGDGTGISVRSIIAAGTTIGCGCSVGPGVFVSGKIKDNTMLMQAPAIKVMLSNSGAF